MARNTCQPTAIKNALKQENLNPEIEEKLLNLQSRHERQMKGNQRPTSEALLNNHHEYSSPMRSRKHTTNRTDEDDEWILDQPKRRPPRSHIYSDKRQSTTRSTQNVDHDVSRTSQSDGDILATSSSTPKRSQPDICESVTESRTPHKHATDGLTRTPGKIASKAATKASIKSPIKVPIKATVKTAAKSPIKVPPSTKTSYANVATPKADAAIDKGAKTAVSVNGADNELSPDGAKRETDKKKQLQVNERLETLCQTRCVYSVSALSFYLTHCSEKLKVLRPNHKALQFMLHWLYVRSWTAIC